MSNSAVTLVGVPGVIGFTISSLMYGVTLGQSFCYAIWFPNDPWLMKTLVFMVFLADTLHMVGSTQIFWKALVACHQNFSWTCGHELPWGGFSLLWLTCIITFAVQSFYCHRIWTISGKNKPLTFLVFASLISTFVCGAWYNVDVARVGTIDYLSTCPLILPFACSSTLCDFLITSAVFKYMWRSGFRKQRTRIQDLALVCINTGLSTCMIAIITGILFLVHGHNRSTVGATGILFGRSYVNSMLAVLNVRKTIRERDMNVYELSTIR